MSASDIKKKLNTTYLKIRSLYEKINAPPTCRFQLITPIWLIYSDNAAL